MSKLHLMGTALVAAAVVAGCNKNEPTAVEAEKPAADVAANSNVAICLLTIESLHLLYHIN